MRKAIVSPPNIAPLWRRVCAMFYDWMLVLSVSLLLSVIAYAIFGKSLQVGMARALFQTLIFLGIYGYFTYFWLRGGQTTGMRAWGIYLGRWDGGQPVRPAQALLRFFVAIPSALLGGLGYAWMLWDRRRMTWHDRYSETQIFIK